MTDPGDDSVILRTVVLWCDRVEDVLKAEFGSLAAGTIRRREDGQLEAVLSFDRNVERRQRQRHFVALTRHPHALQRLDRYTWDISPSVHFPGQYHGFVTLVGVPVPEPWE
jgi:hypothetical protein